MNWPGDSSVRHWIKDYESFLRLRFACCDRDLRLPSEFDEYKPGTQYDLHGMGLFIRLVLLSNNSPALP